MAKLTCLRCQHQWFPHRDTKPQQCPKCKSYGWEAEKTPKVDKVMP